MHRVEPAGGRLIVVANRLPVTCSKDSSGRWKLQISAGGLVSALMGVNNYSTLWIGWPGMTCKGVGRYRLKAGFHQHNDRLVSVRVCVCGGGGGSSMLDGLGGPYQLAVVGCLHQQC